MGSNSKYYQLSPLYKSLKFVRGILEHPVYADLAPSHFHLFPKLKEHLSGMIFNNDGDVKDAVLRILNSMAVNWYGMTWAYENYQYACRNASIEMENI